ncbi:FtsQ-type POTRA domain-containing protein [Clostridium sp. cel8]|jgi:cell division protein FtsQ|uniref:cell division protein FtsQ/DivIB n=1 Tax=unclassified Clostridium TaxID=2614128 RepID=UPI0015F4057B|nr:FtsQ-type POTRA domain-containing protein [Clostridium sp. cel8]MBA5850654.1 FtsQ-type POTRA domain-containing protein [Clostridium sp. cel8]
MSSKLAKTDNELILRRRKRNRIKKGSLFFIFLLAVLCILAVKLPYFNINKIVVYGNKNIQDSEIKSISKIYKGNNIFYINLNESKSSIMENPYVESVTIERKLPSTIVINIKERNAVYYIKSDDLFCIIDKNAVLLEKKKSISNMKLVQLKGIDIGNCKIGDTIKNVDTKKVTAIKEIGNLIEQSSTSFGINLVDVSNSLDIKAYKNKMYIKLGSYDNMRDKLNKALNIIEQEKLNNAEGYVDVRFKSNPVFFIDSK